jgi:uncharacterized C2H2 Zn-finger protein
MTNALLTCVTCDEIFRNRSDLTYHVKRDHQSLVNVKFENGTVTEVKKGEDGMFTCKCRKRFKLSVTLRKHAKSCRGESSEKEYTDMEDVDMLEGVSDASDVMDHDDALISDTSIDCFGALISHENC